MLAPCLYLVSCSFISYVWLEEGVLGTLTQLVVRICFV